MDLMRTWWYHGGRRGSRCSDGWDSLFESEFGPDAVEVENSVSQDARCQKAKPASRQRSNLWHYIDDVAFGEKGRKATDIRRLVLESRGGVLHPSAGAYACVGSGWGPW